MSELLRKLRSAHSDFRAVLREPDTISQEYLPTYYSGLLATGDTSTLSSEAITKLGSRKGRTYIKGSNLLHRVLAREYGSEEIREDPHFLRTQVYQSDAWLLVHLLDEAADRLSRQGQYDGIEQAVGYVDNLLFAKDAKPATAPLSPPEQQAMAHVAGRLRAGLEAHGDIDEFKPVWRALMNAALKETHSRSMKEYRSARTTVGEHSGKLCSFFIAGAGNDDFTSRHYGERASGLHYSARKMGAAAQLLDGYVDFNEDREEVMRDFKPKPGDRSWFLYATLRETADLVLHEQRKHLGCFSSAVKVSLGKLSTQKTFVSSKTGTDEFIEGLLRQAQQSSSRDR